MPDTSEKMRKGYLAVNGWMWVAAYCVCVSVCAYDFACCPLVVETDGPEGVAAAWPWAGLCSGLQVAAKRGGEEGDVEVR